MGQISHQGVQVGAGKLPGCHDVELSRYLRDRDLSLELTFRPGSFGVGRAEDRRVTSPPPLAGCAGRVVRLRGCQTPYLNSQEILDLVLLALPGIAAKITVLRVEAQLRKAANLLLPTHLVEIHTIYLDELHL